MKLLLSALCFLAATVNAAQIPSASYQLRSARTLLQSTQGESDPNIGSNGVPSNSTCSESGPIVVVPCATETQTGMYASKPQFLLPNGQCSTCCPYAKGERVSLNGFTFTFTPQGSSTAQDAMVQPAFQPLSNNNFYVYYLPAGESTGTVTFTPVYLTAGATFRIRINFAAQFVYLNPGQSVTFSIVAGTNLIEFDVIQAPCSGDIIEEYSITVYPPQPPATPSSTGTPAVSSTGSEVVSSSATPVVSSTGEVVVSSTGEVQVSSTGSVSIPSSTAPVQASSTGEVQVSSTGVEVSSSGVAQVSSTGEVVASSTASPAVSSSAAPSTGPAQQSSTAQVQVSSTGEVEVSSTGSPAVSSTGSVQVSSTPVVASSTGSIAQSSTGSVAESSTPVVASSTASVASSSTPAVASSTGSVQVSSTPAVASSTASVGSSSTPSVGSSSTPSVGSSSAPAVGSSSAPSVGSSSAPSVGSSSAPSVASSTGSVQSSTGRATPSTGGSVVSLSSAVPIESSTGTSECPGSNPATTIVPCANETNPDYTYPSKPEQSLPNYVCSCLCPYPKGYFVRLDSLQLTFTPSGTNLNIPLTLTNMFQPLSNNNFYVTYRGGQFPTGTIHFTPNSFSVGATFRIRVNFLPAQYIYITAGTNVDLPIVEGTNLIEFDVIQAPCAGDDIEEYSITVYQQEPHVDPVPSSTGGGNSVVVSSTASPVTPVYSSTGSAAPPTGPVCNGNPTPPATPPTTNPPTQQIPNNDAPKLSSSATPVFIGAPSSTAAAPTTSPSTAGAAPTTTATSTAGAAPESTSTGSAPETIPSPGTPEQGASVQTPIVVDQNQPTNTQPPVIQPAPTTPITSAPVPPTESASTGPSVPQIGGSEQGQATASQNCPYPSGAVYIYDLQLTIQPTGQSQVVNLPLQIPFSKDVAFYQTYTNEATGTVTFTPGQLSAGTTFRIRFNHGTFVYLLSGQSVTFPKAFGTNLIEFDVIQDPCAGDVIQEYSITIYQGSVPTDPSTSTGPSNGGNSEDLPPPTTQGPPPTFCEKYTQQIFGDANSTCYQEALIAAIVTGTVADFVEANFTIPFNVSAAYNVTEIRTQVIEFIGAALGCNAPNFPAYTGPSNLTSVFTGYNINGAFFSQLEVSVNATLESLGVSTADIQYVIVPFLNSFLRGSSQEICQAADCPQASDYQPLNAGQASVQPATVKSTSGVASVLPSVAIMAVVFALSMILA